MTYRILIMLDRLTGVSNSLRLIYPTLLPSADRHGHRQQGKIGMMGRIGRIEGTFPYTSGSQSFWGLVRNIASGEDREDKEIASGEDREDREDREDSGTFHTPVKNNQFVRKVHT